MRETMMFLSSMKKQGEAVKNQTRIFSAITSVGLCAALAGLSSACVKKNQEPKGAVKEFEFFGKNVTERKFLPELRLAALEDIVAPAKDADDKSNGTYVAMEEILANDFDIEMRKHVEVTFNAIDKATFEKIRAAYAFGGIASPIIWRPDKSGTAPAGRYSLTDFLPPIMQATMKHTFRTEISRNSEKKETINGRPKSVYQTFMTQTNCWGTAYEITRRPARKVAADGSVTYEYQVFQMNDKVADRLLNAAEASTLVADLKGKDEQTILQAMNDVKIGDFVNFYRKTPDGSPDGPLMHVVIAIDKGLFFERTGPDKAYVMRLVTPQNLTKGYTVARAVTKITRPATAFKPILEVESELSQRTVMDGTTSEQIFTLKSYDLVEDATTGRVTLPPDAYTAQPGTIRIVL
jgi:hypothetical protein